MQPHLRRVRVGDGDAGTVLETKAQSRPKGLDPQCGVFSYLKDRNRNPQYAGVDRMDTRTGGGSLVPPDLGRLYLQSWIACNSTIGMHDFIYMCHRMTWALTEDDFLEKGTT